jgi:hypothetical protein
MYHQEANNYGKSYGSLFSLTHVSNGK